MIMIELRKNPRTNVVWRAVIKLGEENIVAAKVVNISKGGVLIHCPANVEVNKEYRLLLNVPHIDQTSDQTYQVHCKMRVLNSLLSSEYYHINLKFTELSDLHRCLFEAWLSLVSKYEQLS
jgi:c-di-GMP-binding flagellar brake protein YcgR